MSTLSPEVSRYLPIFKVWAEDGKHPPVALDRPVCVIGRREDGVNLPLQAPEVSKLHALVVRTQREVYVRDLASRNGVQRNGAPVQEVGLSDEDVLRIGSYTLRCASGFGRGEDAGAADAGAVAESPLPPAELVAPDGPTYPFPTGRHTLLIGQRQGCEVRLEGDEKVAPVHAILFEIDGTRYVRDLAAPSGTYLNNQRIHQAKLEPGDAIRVGDVTLRYTLVDVAAEDDDAAATRDAVGVDGTAPGVDLVDSVLSDSVPHGSIENQNVATADSMIVPEITMEDSRGPAPAPRGASPISEYDMDVVDADPRRESTFAGEVIRVDTDAQSDGDANAGGDGGTNPLTADDAKPVRPELPPAASASLQPGVDDSSIPIAGSFHDQILADHLLQDIDDPHERSNGPLTVAKDAPIASAKPQAAPPVAAEASQPPAAPRDAQGVEAPAEATPAPTRSRR